MGTVIKKKEDKTQGLVNLIFSWSLADVMKEDMYKYKVKPIRETFSSTNHYFQSLIYPLIEETHADLRSNMTTLFRATACEIYEVKRVVKDHERLRYKLSLSPGKYEPEVGDLIALTEVKPKRIDDLDRPKRPYCVALIQGTKDGNVTILSSKPISFVKEDEATGTEKDKLFAVYLTNLTTNLRIWNALHPDVDGGCMKIINSVLGNNPRVDQYCTLCLTNQVERISMSKSRESLNLLGLDASQEAAVLSVIATVQCSHQNSVKLIWGPPGTGKTKTIAALVYALFGMKCRTLTCAPTNVAVIGVTKRLMSLIGGMLMYETYGLGDVVLFGNGERMKIDDHEDLSDVFLEHRACVLSRCFAPKTGWTGTLESMICLLEDPQGQYLQYLSREREKSSKGKMPSNERSQTKCHEKDKNYVPWTFKEFLIKTFTNIGQQIMNCITGLCTHMPTKCLPLEVVKQMMKVPEILQEFPSLMNKLDASCESFRESLEGNERPTNLHLMRLQFLELLRLLRGTYSVPDFFERYQINTFCLKHTILIFCTASSSAKLHTKGMAPIELVIIDEAAQLKECESSIPLQLPGLGHAILVGDEKQLPAMVQSKICENAGFGRSLFERLVILGHKKHLLNVQYRMHPSISLFPNTEFYSNGIKNGQNVMERAYERRFLKGKFFGSFSFIDINNGKEEFDDRKSLKNMVEVSVIAEIVLKLYEECSLSKQKVRVGCISPYKAQVSAIQERLGNTYSTDANDKFSVNVRSVDGFQGGEEDIIIISTVRCNGNGSVGFLSNCQRVNVALTRARYCLWILGSAATLLNSGSVWKKLVLDAKSRDCFHNVYEDKNLALAITNAFIKLDQQNSLFCMDSILFRMSKWKVCFSAQFQESMIRLRNSGILEKVVELLVKLSDGWREQVEDKSLGNLNGDSSQNSGILEKVVELLVKLSDGWREQVKDKSLGNLNGASSQLLESYDVKEPLKLIWTIEILREQSSETQVIKIWDILPKIEIPTLVKELDVLLGNYSSDYMSRCLCKRIEGNLTLPMTWPLDANATSSNSSKDASHELALKLAATSLSNAPRSYPSRSHRKNYGGWRSRNTSNRN